MTPEGRETTEKIGEDLWVRVRVVKLLDVVLEGKEVKVEVWVVDDEMFDHKSFPEPIGSFTLAACLPLWAVLQTGLKNVVTHHEADGVAFIRRSAADMARDCEIDNLAIHEAAHLRLGHRSLDPYEGEKEVAKMIGEVEVANKEFGRRYFDRHPRLKYGYTFSYEPWG